MNHTIEQLLHEIHEKDVQELVRMHIRDINFDQEKRKVAIFLDKKYAINLLESNNYAPDFLQAIHHVYGESVDLRLQIHRPHRAHEREMLVPQKVHY